MTEGIEIAGWIPFTNAREAHPAAFGAFIHAGTKAMLLLFWQPTHEQAGDGVWTWRVRLPVAWLHESLEAESDAEAAKRWADGLLGRMGLGGGHG